MEWRFLNTNFNDGAYNMAVDEAILNTVSTGESPPTLRFYGWNPPSMSIGYFQKYENSIDLDGCKKHGVDVVRRLTGGRAVLHDEELTYSIIIPDSYPNMPKSVTDSYKILSQGLLRGFHHLNINALFSTDSYINPKTCSSGACFDAPSIYELTVEGKKIVGSAQTRQKNTILQHGSILNKLQEDVLFDCLYFPNSEIKNRLKNSFTSKATSIEITNGTIIDFNSLCNAFKLGFSEALEISFFNDSLSTKELQLIKLFYDKYKSNEWTSKNKS